MQTFYEFYVTIHFSKTFVFFLNYFLCSHLHFLEAIMAELTEKEALGQKTEFRRIIENFNQLVQSSDFIKFSSQFSENEKSQWNAYLEATAILHLKIKHDLLSMEELVIFNAMASDFLDNVMIDYYKQDTLNIINSVKSAG